LSVRHQLPVHSPTTFRSLLQGALGATGSDARSAVITLVKQHWSAQQVVLTDSGTSALLLAIKVAVSPNGIVALPAWGCYDLATAAEGANVRVALYDVDPHTLAPDAESLGRALGTGAQAVVVAHFHGVPADMDVIKRSADAAGATVIEDAAQAIGTTWRGRPAGANAALGVLSFGRGKGLNGGGGGALLINETPRSAPQLNVDGEHAGWGELVRASAQWLLARPRFYALPASLPFLKLGETIYHRPHAPQALSRASASILRANWADAHAATAVRRRTAERLRITAANAGWRNINTPAGGEAGYLRLPILSASARNYAMMVDGARLGIMPGYPQTLVTLEQFRSRCVNAQAAFPGAEHLAQTLVTLPTHELLTETDLNKIEDWLRSY
jgi:dTDP-4-amino-4,6-dideoxygalactose transaminase